MFGVPVNADRRFSAGRPTMLFEGPYVRNVLDYDVAPDRRFLMIKPSQDELSPPELRVVVNWVDELMRRAGRQRAGS